MQNPHSLLGLVDQNETDFYDGGDLGGGVDDGDLDGGAGGGVAHRNGQAQH